MKGGRSTTSIKQKNLIFILKDSFNSHQKLQNDESYK